ncbi:MAG TPA: 2-amino-4-hydroxy-6-hydroxymethyldihydropteridine diphosphokinase [Anaerolineales bacterium]
MRNPARCASPAPWGSRSRGRPAALGELAFVSIGSNLDPEHNLPRAIERLTQLGRLRGISGVYQNPAIGGRPQPDYLNAAVLLEVDRPPDALRAELRRIEAESGRVRTSDKYAPRTIDLDLSLYGDQIYRGPGSQIPDPRITRLAHLAIPLADLAPDYRHPELGESLAEIADRLRADSKLVPRTDVSEELSRLLAAPGDNGR